MMDNTVGSKIYNVFPKFFSRIVLQLRFNHFHMPITIVTTTFTKYCAQAVILFVKIVVF